MKKIAIVIALLSLAASADAQQTDGPYSYEDLSKIIATLCQKAAFGYHAEIEAACPLILKRLEPQIAAEKSTKEEKK